MLQPDLLHHLVIHDPTFEPEFPEDQPLIITIMTPGQLLDAPAQLLLVNPRHR